MGIVTTPVPVNLLFKNACIEVYGLLDRLVTSHSIFDQAKLPFPVVSHVSRTISAQRFITPGDRKTTLGVIAFFGGFTNTDVVGENK